MDRHPGVRPPSDLSSCDVVILHLFFFSSRRRHTRSLCDWSSDVCSSDLAEDTERGEQRALPLTLAVLIVAFGALVAAALPVLVGLVAITIALGLVTLAAR